MHRGSFISRPGLPFGPTDRRAVGNLRYRAYETGSSHFLKRNLALGLAVIFLAAFSSAPLGAEERAPAKKTVFSFSDGLPGAQVTLKGNEQVLSGVWQTDRFRFQGMPGVTDVLVTDFAMKEGKPARPVIWIQPLKNFEYTLDYLQVPMGRKLTLFFGLGNSALKKSSLEPVQFEVWIGKKKLFDSTLLAKGWLAKQIDLTLPWMLKRKFHFRFVIRNLGQGTEGLVFNGEIE